MRAKNPTGNGYKHGMRKTRTYQSWFSMKRRCIGVTTSDPMNFKNYKARGIKVCDRWLSFENFYADMGERPNNTSLDRIDVNLGYEPGNCRWATVLEQQNNKRNSRLYSLSGETLTIQQWARRLGVSWPTIHYRISAGWPLDQALTAKPVYLNRRYVRV